MPTTRTPASPPPHDWGVATVDVDAYLDRVGVPAMRPSPEALATLHEAHVRTIPFENVDIQLGHTPSLQLSDITDKLVRRRRGGYCFEHGLLFAACLERLGYQVTRGMARVRPDSPHGSRTHLVLFVDVAGTRFLADPGFGSGLLMPLPLEDGATTEHGGWPYRLRRDGRLWRLENPTSTGSGWRRMPSTRPHSGRSTTWSPTTSPPPTRIPRSPSGSSCNGSTAAAAANSSATDCSWNTPRALRPAARGGRRRARRGPPLGHRPDEDELTRLRQVYAGTEPPGA